MKNNTWMMIRQRAGPLVKECRFRRPSILTTDDPYTKAEKNKITNVLRDSSFRRTPTDRLELMLALFGYTGRTYCLTFADEFLPENFAGVRAAWKNFLRNLKRHHGGGFDYVYVIEGRHGDHRYHIHLVLRDEDFDPECIRRYWPGGMAIGQKPLLKNKYDTYRRTARYFTKERTDGVVLPIGARTWVASRSLYQKLQAPEKRRVSSGRTKLPNECILLSNPKIKNMYGEYEFISYMIPQSRSKC